MSGVDENDNGFIGDVIIVDEKIEAVTSDPEVTGRYKADKVIDATGKIVMPGGVDPHVHLEYPQGGNHIVSCDDFYTGSVAAVCGGTTTIMDFVEADNSVHEKLMDALAARNSAASGRSVVDYSFHMTLNRSDPATLDEEVPAVVSAGVTSFKIYTAYDGIRLTDAQLIPAMAAMARHGGLPIVHCECHDLIMARVAECKAKGWTDAKYQPYTRPAQGESEATHRIAMLADAAEVPAGVHIVHVTAEAALPTIVNAGKYARGPSRMGPVTGEVCAHHLALTDTAAYGKEHSISCDFICAPPMRPQQDIDAMWDALACGTLSFTVTDHCPFTRKQRRGLRRVPEFRKRWDGNTVDDMVVADVAAAESAEKRAYEQWFGEAAGGSLPPFYAMPGGLAGIETRLLLTFHYGVVGRGVPLGRFVAFSAANAAKRYNLWPRKGALAKGADADVTIIDPARETLLSAKTLHQNCDHCPFEGLSAKCFVDTVLARGTVLVENGVFQGAVKHTGVFLPRKPYN